MGEKFSVSEPSEAIPGASQNDLRYDSTTYVLILISLKRKNAAFVTPIRGF
jgi:hypothetical protein